MAVKRSAKKRSKARRRAVQVVRGGLTRLKLRTVSAPELPPPKPLPVGVLRPDTEKARVAKEWLDSHSSPSENPARVILVLVLLTSLWIGLLTWFISQMEVR